MSDGVAFAAVAPDAPEALALYADFIREADGPLGATVDLEREIANGPPADLRAPGGVLLLARANGEPAAMGGVRHLRSAVAEVKSMYVDPAQRGRGIGRALLEELHAIAREHGCRAVRLDSSGYLTEALALYRAAGYRPVPDYNANPKADVWFEREL